MALQYDDLTMSVVAGILFVVLAHDKTVDFVAGLFKITDNTTAILLHGAVYAAVTFAIKKWVAKQAAAPAMMVKA